MTRKPWLSSPVVSPTAAVVVDDRAQALAVADRAAGRRGQVHEVGLVGLGQHVAGRRRPSRSSTVVPGANVSVPAVAP